MTSFVDRCPARTSSTLPGWRRRLTAEEKRTRTRSLRPPVVTTEGALKVCKERARKRWSRLVSASNSRIAREMREHLGAEQWRAFVKYANDEHKAPFLAAFAPSSHVLACEGPVEGGGFCPRAFEIDLVRPSSVDDLDALHVDHLHDLTNVCDVWRTIVPKLPSSWDHGLDRDALCQALFGIEPRNGMPRCLHFRCGNKMEPRSSELRRESAHTLRGARPRWCHRHGAHHARYLCASDLVCGVVGGSRP
mmetsp:Transcript_24642/g.67043  ORF Transcript_24642/g.67043 Transcript_24642/m.67043 type:complete len:249 (+) Transcript_24642:289-1035(+)